MTGLNWKIFTLLYIEESVVCLEKMNVLYCLELSNLKAYPRKLGEKVGWLSKATSGLLFFIAIVFILFFPLFYYSTVNPSSQYNFVSIAKVTIGMLFNVGIIMVFRNSRICSILSK